MIKKKEYLMIKKKEIKESPKLFGPRNDGYHNACVNYMNDPWYLYAMGYKAAADILINNIKDTQTHQDMLLYPIVYLYRQYIELMLKIFIRDSQRLLDKSFKTKPSHGLKKLWEKARPLIEEIYHEEDITPLLEAELVIIEFESMDPYATAFRYPEDNNGKKSLPDIKLINIAQFEERLENLIDLLEGVTAGVSEYLSNKLDMNEYY